MNQWCASTLGNLIELQRGHDLPAQERERGAVPIIGSFGVTGTHRVAKYEGPGVAIGRSGASIGCATFVEGPYWPLNTCLFVSDFKGNDPRWVYFLLDLIDFTAFNSGSAQPSLNRNYLRELSVLVPPRTEQRRIATLLAALDDKIDANTPIAMTANALAGLVFDNAVREARPCRMSAVLTPILGGTPARSRAEYWGGDTNWVTAKDVTSAPFGVVIGTQECISAEAVSQTKSKALPKGSIILTARGTVGAVARLGESAALNQSCYGFVPEFMPPGVLYFSILHATQRAKAIAHGSVFDTITMRTFDHLEVADLSERAWAEIEAKLSPLLARIEHVVRENVGLAAIRDALLPQLMSGRVRVKDAEQMVGDVV